MDFEIKEYVCPCCGEKMYSQYYVDGWIDHVLNFYDHREYFEKAPVRVCMQKIALDGNSLRDVRSIKKRLNCFMMWDCISKETKQTVSFSVNSLIEGIELLELEADKILKNIPADVLPFVVKNARFSGAGNTADYALVKWAKGILK